MINFQVYNILVNLLNSMQKITRLKIWIIQKALRKCLKSIKMKALYVFRQLGFQSNIWRICLWQRSQSHLHLLDHIMEILNYRFLIRKQIWFQIVPPKKVLRYFINNQMTTSRIETRANSIEVLQIYLIRLAHLLEEDF